MILTIALMPLTWLSSGLVIVVVFAWLIFLFAVSFYNGNADRGRYAVGLITLMLLPQSCVEDVRNYAHGYRSCDERCEPFNGRHDGARCLCERKAEVVQRFAPVDGKGP